MNAAVAIPFFVALQHNDAQAEVGADLARPAAGRGTDGRRSAVAGTIPDLVLITLVSVPRSTNMHFETPLEFLESRTYDEINLGDTSSLIRTLRPEDVKLFALMSGDMNPALANAEFRHSGLFQDFIAHGMWTASLMSTTLGTQFPGPGDRAHRVDGALCAAGDDRRHDHRDGHRQTEVRSQPPHHPRLRLLQSGRFAGRLGPGRSAGAGDEDPHQAHDDAGDHHFGQVRSPAGPGEARRRPGADRHGGGAPLRQRVAQGRAARRRGEPDRPDPDWARNRRSARSPRRTTSISGNTGS
jgi:hypothetical protein